MSKNIVLKNIIKVTSCLIVFAVLFTITAFASGSFSSTYSITSPSHNVGTLLGSTRFDIGSDNRTVTIALSNSIHHAGGIHISLERRGILGGWSAGSNTLLFSANQSRSLTSRAAGTYRLRMINQYNGAHGSGQPTGTARNSGNIRVSWN